MTTPDTPLLGDLTAPAMILDQYEAPITNPDINSVDAATRAFFTNAPPWLDKLMTVRNAIVGRLGFSAGRPERGDLPERFEVGQQLGPFSILERTNDEIVMGGTDRRMELEISIWVPPGEGVLRVTTRANSVDRAGRAYLARVKPGHRLIAPLVTRRAAR